MEGCFCKWCVADRARLGLEGDVVRHNKIVAIRVEKRLFDLLKSRNPKPLSVFRHRLTAGVRDELEFNSHVEVATPQDVRYLRTLGKDCVGLVKNQLAVLYSEQRVMWGK